MTLAGLDSVVLHVNSPAEVEHPKGDLAFQRPFVFWSLRLFVSYCLSKDSQRRVKVLHVLLMFWNHALASLAPKPMHELQCSTACLPRMMPQVIYVALVELSISPQVYPCPAQSNRAANTMHANTLHISKKSGSEEAVSTSTVCRDLNLIFILV
jgi:hypothetical protein